MDLLNSLVNTSNNKYGLIIVFITIITRIFVVSIAWNYGVFIVALKKSFPDIKYVELEWIASLAQGLGSLLAPLYLILSRRFGIRTTFMTSLFLCCFSLFISSFVKNVHYLFITYSVIFGVGSSMSMIIGSILTGIYFPTGNKFHVLSTVFISLGFPLGFLILNPLTEYLIELYDWQYVKLIYSFITLVCMMLFCPFFTDKFAEQYQSDDEESYLIQSDIRDSVKLYKIAANSFWFLGLLLISISINSILINLNGFFQSSEISPPNAAYLVMIFGASDLLFRILLAILGNFFNNHLSIFYILSGLIGSILCLIWLNITSFGGHSVLCILFGFCPAVYMSLMYPISTEINGVSKIQKTYTLNVLTGAIGIIIGPILSGILLDRSIGVIAYKTVFEMSAVCFVLSMCLFVMAKMVLLYISSHFRINGIDGIF